ncbi:serine/threonine protein kinase [soil metagenome]
MASATHISYPIKDRSYLSLVKRQIHKIALEANFRKTLVDQLDIIIAEMGSNLVKHASGGEILAGIVEDDGETALELLCIDSGPGIRDIKRMMTDGVSTTKTLGQGLGSIQRLSGKYEIYSQPGWGTILLSRLYKNKIPDKQIAKLAIKPLIIARVGETFCGDGWYQKTNKDFIKIFIGDGLGHGPQANLAVNEAINAFKLCPDNSPVENIRFIHHAVKKTRGAVVFIIVYDIKNKNWKICGVGNISLRIMGYLINKGHVCYNGIVGHNIPNTMNDQSLTQEQVRQFVLCSDGISSRWDWAKYPMIQKQDLAVQAAAIYKDFARKTDDMSIIIGKPIN